MAPESKPINRDAKFIQLWSDMDFDPGMKIECAKKAGFPPTTAGRNTGKIINSLINNKKMVRELKRAGVDMKKLAQKLAIQLDAVHPLAKGTHYDEKEKKWVGPPDNLAQSKAIELGLKLHDTFVPARIELDKRETKQIVFSAEVVHRLERFNSQRQRMELGETFDVEPIPDQQG